jgi:hypothetical protein
MSNGDCGMDYTVAAKSMNVTMADLDGKTMAEVESLFMQNIENIRMLGHLTGQRLDAIEQRLDECERYLGIGEVGDTNHKGVQQRLDALEQAPAKARRKSMLNQRTD